MRLPQKPVAKRQKSFIKSISSPVGGLNARDPISEMPPEDALILNNYFCTPFDVRVRKGYSNWSTGFGAQVNTLASYVPLVSGNAKMFAWSSDKVYDVSTVGAIGAAVVSGNVESKFQWVNYGTSGGNFLFAVSGSDLPLVYNGTVWSNVFSAAFNTTISTLTSVGTTATATMAAPHNMKTGMSITIAGVTPAGYNGTYVITVTGASTFTYTLAGALGVVTVMGTATPTLNLAITGVDPSTFIHTMVFKSRLWGIEKDSLKAWYMPALSIGGAAAAVDLSAYFTQGGYLMAMCNWSLDAGQGMDDYAVFISSNGQVAVYKGTDPSSANTWALVGIFDIGSPIGRRCFAKYAGDMVLMSKDGLLPLSKALMSTRVNTKIAVTEKVQDSMSDYIANYSSTFGWQVILYPAESMLLLNIPTTSGSVQFAMNTINQSWSTFSGWDAYCWVLHQDHIYFGSGTTIGKAWDTYYDNTDSIDFEGMQSFSYFGDSAQLKHVKMVRPVIATDGAPSILLGVNADFDMSVPTGVPTFSPSTAAVWDTSLWDVGIWGGEPTIKRDWQTASAIGYCVAAHMVGQAGGIQLRWQATDYMLQDGGMV